MRRMLLATIVVVTYFVVAMPIPVSAGGATGWQLTVEGEAGREPTWSITAQDGSLVRKGMTKDQAHQALHDIIETSGPSGGEKLVALGLMFFGALVIAVIAAAVVPFRPRKKRTSQAS